MKKITLTILIILFTTGITKAQTGIGTTTPDASAILDVSSSTKGLLFPRMTTLERDAIVNPATGLTVFNTTSNALEINKGTTIAPLWTASTGAQGVAGLLSAGSTTGNTPFWDGTSWITNSSTLFNNGGNIGIGTTNPTATLHTSGSTNGGISNQISNTNYGLNSYSVLSLTNDTNAGAHFFLNSSVRTADGGANNATLRNDIGNLNLQSQGANGLTILAVSGKVGVNNSSPTETLDIVGKTKTSDFQVTTGAGAGKVLTSDASGNASWQQASGLPNGTMAGNTLYWNGTSWLTNNSNLYNNGANIGIGTISPTANLHISGSLDSGISSKITNTSDTMNAFAVMSLTNDTGSGTHLFLNSSARLTDGGLNNATLRNDAGDLNLQSQGANGITIQANSGNIGIGTTTPGVTLDVVGTTRIQALNIPAAAGVGKILTSDTAGNATWQNNSMPAGTAIGQMNYWNGTSWVTVAPGVQDQTLTFCNGKPNWGPCPTVFTIGQNYQGGNIAYLDASGLHGLIAGPLYNITKAWDCDGLFMNAVSTSGLTNTNTVYASCGSDPFGVITDCYELITGGYSDWYLPSKEEMALMYPNKTALGFSNTFYWTSSEFSNTTAWTFNMGTGAIGVPYNKFSSYKWRPIRSF